MVSPDGIHKLEQRVEHLRMTLADELSVISDLRLEAMDLDQDVFEKSRRLQHEQRTGLTPSGNDSIADMTECFFDLQEEFIEMQCETQVMLEQTELLQTRTKRMKDYLRNKASPTKKKIALERQRSFTTCGDRSRKSLQSAPGRMMVLGPAAA
jgi:hypothetical protein